MRRAILIEDRDDLIPLFILNLNMYVGLEVDCVRNHLEVLELLKDGKKVDIIVSKNNVAQDETAYRVYRYLEERGLKTPVVVLGQETRLSKICKILDINPDVKVLVRTCADILGVTAEEMAHLQVPDFFPIPTTFFKGLDHLICDVFERTRAKNPTYEKVFSEGEAVASEKLDKLIKSGPLFLYVPAKFRLKFASSVTEKLLTSLNSPSLSNEERVEVTDKSMQMVAESMRSAGLQEATIQLAQESIRSMVSVVSKLPLLSQLLENLMSDKLSFRYKHCQVVTFICFHILDNIEWGTKEAQSKLAFVAFFHDISLTSDEEVRIHSDEDLADAGFGEKQKELIRRHAITAADMIKEYPNLPLGAEIIIKQHHGSRAGIGLSTLSPSISPLAQVFWVAEEYTQIALRAQEQGKKISNKKFVKFLRDRTGNFANFGKIIDALENLKI